MSFEMLETARQVFDALGGHAGVGKLTGAKSNTMSMWLQAESFPPNKYVAMTNALRAVGKTAPDSLWRMQAPAEGAS